MKADSSKWILYSTCDEDPVSELRALNIDSDDSVLCVTGSGCRALSLISCNPATLTSIDSSPGQSYLLELKLAAIRKLSYEDLLRFFGIDGGTDRWALYKGIEPELSAEAQAYFTSYKRKIEKGVLFSGRHELFYIRVVAPVARILFGRAFKKMFTASTLEEQRHIYNTEVDGPMWRWLITNGISEKSLGYIFNDPSYQIENDMGPVGQYLLARLNHAFSNHLAKDSDWLSFSFMGRYLNRGVLPHFLLHDNYLKIRSARTKVKIVTADIFSFMDQQPERAYNKFSLSDITSCIGRERFRVLLDKLIAAGRDGGRICYRNFLADRPIPESLRNTLRRDDELCRSLDWDDKAFAYRFEVATLSKA